VVGGMPIGDQEDGEGGRAPRQLLAPERWTTSWPGQIWKFSSTGEARK